MTRNDLTITCKDCGRKFVFRADEQNFFAEKGYDEPTRCKDCRTARKNGRQTAGSGPRSGVQSGGFTERELYPAVCAACGEKTMIPFKPREGRPVYCRDCFQKK
ncbi:MAG: zinc-binding protein [Clostridiales bacterium]|nr:zinc-binding protein [Clostridiales bacterium]